MIQKETRLSVADSCGVWSVGVFQIYRSSGRRFARAGDFLRVSAKRVRPGNFLSQGTKHRAYLVRCVFSETRIDGSLVSSGANSCVLLKKRMTPRGRELSGPVSYRVKKRKFSSSFSGIY